MSKKIRVFQACSAHRFQFAIPVRSGSDPGLIYKVTGFFERGEIRCGCRGFRYRGTCKHTNLVERRCGWNAFDSKEAQTLEQEERHVCPRCGGRTIDEPRGRF